MLRLTISTQPISTMRWPSAGSRPVVSVSRIIWRMRKALPVSGGGRPCRPTPAQKSKKAKAAFFAARCDCRTRLLTPHLARDQRIGYRYYVQCQYRSQAKAADQNPTNLLTGFSASTAGIGQGQHAQHHSPGGHKYGT